MQPVVQLEKKTEAWTTTVRTTAAAASSFESELAPRRYLVEELGELLEVLEVRVEELLQARALHLDGDAHARLGRRGVHLPERRARDRHDVERLEELVDRLSELGLGTRYHDARRALTSFCLSVAGSPREDTFISGVSSLFPPDDATHALPRARDSER